jgi:hypothetical protein
MNRWKFDSPRNTAVIADRFFVEKKEPCLYVVHDESDGGWQFLTENTNGDAGRAIVVSLARAVSTDPSIDELFDLPLGWTAFRETSKSAWQRKPGRP